MIKRRLLGKNAIDYIRDQLEQSGALSKLLLQTLELGAGVAWTYVPPEIDQATVEDLAYASVTPSVGPESFIVGDAT
jgi:hypothetical protein